MKEFWKLYKKTFTGFPAYCRDMGNALADFGAALLVVSLPLTFPVLYPLAMLWKKVKP